LAAGMAKAFANSFACLLARQEFPMTLPAPLGNKTPLLYTEESDEL